MKRISKRVREEAALICAISASWPRGSRHLYLDVEEAIGASNEATSLACDALIAAGSRKLTSAEHLEGRYWPREEDAEAEALLRTGWSPA